MLSTILSRYLGMTLLRGIAWILFGIAIFVWPGISLATLTMLFGIFALADGIVNVFGAIGGRNEYENWWVLLLGGLAGIVVGLLTFMYPGVTALTLLYLIALWAIVTGIFELVAAVHLRKEIEGEFWLGLAGLASVAFGVLLFARPGAGMLTVLWLLASYAIVFGTMLVVLAFEARGFVKRVSAGMPRAAAH